MSPLRATFPVIISIDNDEHNGTILFDMKCEILSKEGQYRWFLFGKWELATITVAKGGYDGETGVDDRVWRLSCVPEEIRSLLSPGLQFQDLEMIAPYILTILKQNGVDIRMDEP